MSQIKRQEIASFFILFIGDIMLLFIKGLIVGMAKIIPGVSGAMLLVNFNIYEKLINVVTNFFNNWKDNLKFLIIFGSGVLISIVLGSGIILYLLTNYKFLTMMFFIGLIVGGTYNFSKKVVLDKVNILILFVTLFLFLILILNNTHGNYVLKNNFNDSLVLFVGGIIEILASVIPGISGTSLLMMLGIYDLVLNFVANSINIIYVVDNLGLYLSFLLGMFLSFIVSVYLVSFLFKRYRKITYAGVLGLSISSIISIMLIIFKIKITVIEIILGIMLFTSGLLIDTIMNK